MDTGPSIEDNIARACECGALADLAVVPMGSDGLDERVFNTLEQVCAHSPKLWWLYLSQCQACGQHWLVAQDERIYDNLYLKRLAQGDAQAIAASQDWPGDFLTYEQVLAAGRASSTRFRFFDPLSLSLQWTVEDLRKERPEISPFEIADLLGLSPRHARMLYWKVRLFGTGRLQR